IFGNNIAQTAAQAGQNADCVPEQRGIGGPMDIGFHNRRIGAQLLAIFQTVVDGRFNDRVIELLHCGGTQPVERLVEGVVAGNRLTVEAGELSQRVSVIYAFAQFPVIPILDAHQDQRAENLVRGQTRSASFRFLQTALQIAANQFHQFVVVIQEVGNLFQQRIQPDALLQKFQIGECDLGIIDSHTDSFMRLSVKIGPFQWRFPRRCARICTSWPSRKSLSKNVFEPSSTRLASWEIYVLVLCRSSTTSVVTPIAAAKPLHQSSTAPITKSVLRGMAKAPVSSSVRKTSMKSDNSWTIIVNCANSSTSGSPCRRSYPACAFEKNERREANSNGTNHEFPNKPATATAH